MSYATCGAGSIYTAWVVSDIGGGSDDVRNIELLEEVMIPTVRAAAKPYPERILCVQVIL